MVVGVLRNDQDGMDLEPKKVDWDYDQGSQILQQEPLRHLLNIKFPMVNGYRGFRASFFFCSILKHCPGLRCLEMSRILNQENILAVIKTVRDYCPTITELSITWSSCKTVMGLIENIPPQLERIYVCRLCESTPSVMLVVAITRHSETLREIELGSSEQIESITPQSILATCRVLEVLLVQGASANRSFLLLENAVETEWASTRIRRLEISVKFILAGGSPEYFGDPTMVTWTKQDHNHWNML